MIRLVDAIAKRFGHKFICGMTQSGKTYLAVKIMECWHGPVLFFNPQEVPAPAGFITAGYNSSSIAFGKALHTGKKINYVPLPDQKEAEKELESLVKFLHAKFRGKGLLLCADECQDFARQGKYSPLLFVARRGLGRGITGLFVAQSPADVDKVIVRQSLTHVVFEITVYDQRYFVEHRLPGEQIVEKLRKGGQHSFCMWDNRALSGPYKI